MTMPTEVSALDAGPLDPGQLAAEQELEQLRRSIDLQAMNEAFERIRAASYTGRDREHLATVVVDGGGIVQRVTLGSTATRRSAEAVEIAVLAAIGAAVAELRHASQQVIDAINQQTAQLQAATARYEQTVLVPLRTKSRAIQAELRAAIDEVRRHGRQ